MISIILYIDIQLRTQHGKVVQNALSGSFLNVVLHQSKGFFTESDLGGDAEPRSSTGNLIQAISIDYVKRISIRYSGIVELGVNHVLRSGCGEGVASL